VIEPWEDPWAPASPAGPRRNGTEMREAKERDAASGPTPRRWGRSAPNRPPASKGDERAGEDDGDGRAGEDDATARLTSIPSVPVDKLSRWALPLALDTSDHLDLSGHRSTVQDLLETAPPSIRFLLWPRLGPLDASEGPRRHSLELALERDAGDLFVARSWADDRRADASIQGRIAAGEADRDWFDRQLVHFVEQVLSLA